MTSTVAIRVIRVLAVAGITGIAFSACGRPAPETAGSTVAAQPVAAQKQAGCDADNGGLTLPAGFCATIFADKIGHARHLAVAQNGDVYVNTWSTDKNHATAAPGGFIVALRDADRDGRAETVERFGTVYVPGRPGGGTGIAIHDGSLYVEADNTIVRYRLTAAPLAPTAAAEVVLSALPVEGDHLMHPFAIAADGTMFVNSGSMTNSCQEKNRTLESRGSKACPELATHAGIWRYDATKANQVFSPTDRFATGMRNTVGLAVSPGDNQLYAAIHGRDQLADNWPKLYTVEQNNELPAEMFARVTAGDDFGWPYCYYDGLQNRQVLAPEFGGDGGHAVGACADKAKPLVVFPAHWAPEAIAFSSALDWPQPYQAGAFVSFHGSWNRKPAQAGFLVAFVPFAEGKPVGRYEEFATGFAGPTMPVEPTQAPHRPMGLAVGPGALYVSDEVTGRIWRIVRVTPTR